MTTAQMLSAFRFRMEDPDGEKWDSGSLTELYKVFTSAQRMAVDLYIAAKRYEYLREIQASTSLDLSGGSSSLPSDFYLKIFLQNNSGDFIVINSEPPREDIGLQNSIHREDKQNVYAYLFGSKCYLQGYDSSLGSFTLGYIQTLTDITGSADPVTSENVQELTLSLSEWIAWGLDRQFDRQQEVAAQIKLKYGVDLGGQK